MVGRALVASLSTPSAANAFAPEIYSLVRHKPAHAREIFFDGVSRIDVGACESFDAVVHLAGENVGSGSGPLAFLGRWDDAKKHAILNSRRAGTTLLSKSLAALRQPPRVFVSASGVGTTERTRVMRPSTRRRRRVRASSPKSRACGRSLRLPLPTRASAS